MPVSVEDRGGLDLDQQVGRGQGDDPDPGQRGHRGAAQPGGGTGDPVDDQRHLVGGPVDEVDGQSRHVVEGAADPGQGGGDVQVALLDLTALAAGYVGTALDNPDLYRVMFDASVDLEDLPAADATLEHMVRAVGRARADGRFRPDADPLALATQSWTVAHGLVSLVAGGPLPRATLVNGVILLTTLFIATGDDPVRCGHSVETGWGSLRLAGPG